MRPDLSTHDIEGLLRMRPSRAPRVTYQPSGFEGFGQAALRFGTYAVLLVCLAALIFANLPGVKS